MQVGGGRRVTGKQGFTITRTDSSSRKKSMTLLISVILTKRQTVVTAMARLMDRVEAGGESKWIETFL